jgi:hypothetical protein
MNNENKNSIKAFTFNTIKLPDVKEVSGKDWILFGAKNDFPNKILELYNNSSIHNTAIQAIFDGIRGEGIVGLDQEIVNRTGETLQSIFDKITLDYLLFGGYAVNVIWNREGTGWAELYHLPFEKIRAQKTNQYEVVENYYYCKDWRNPTKNPPLKYPAYNTKKTRDQYASQVYYCMDYAPGQVVYPLPYYRGAINDIELDIRISKFHNSNVANGLSPSMLINFRKGEPTPEEQQIIYRQIEEAFGGEENAGRFFLHFSLPGHEIELTPIESANDSYYLTLEERITSRILTAHRITSPLLIGIRTNSGFSSNKDEILVSYGHLMGTVILPKQKKMIDSFSKILGQNIVINPSPIIIDNETVETDENVVEDNTQNIIEK